ncbi:Cyanide-insensitive cytochrome bd-type quinol oxidase subunit I [Granulibacter bethesdensis]|uniref:Cyanide-insensitive cytochrome bd-type quinol oxidase subunit I n=2 Tax=Granulibacter bethesdensis TaxID=364410 RepID=A0AAC9P7Q7_9PROT|nr:Cyanide-insensitive cytochrome bd-type quinol oxidase subunit I [Granulibacter bethesdensis]APH60937.1 Cyanide-insensitive cytochrome bd-type quinol oxidase subunit I [Granulibacter bethesdensis]
MMPGMDAIFLARLQFAFTVGFHIVFPAFSIGLASYLAVLEGLWLKTGRPVYLDLFRYWSKIFAVGFGMGVVSGLVMSYEFGTNWGAFAAKAGPVIGPLMGYEVLTAFFLEAGFLGIMLFGMEKVGKKLHFLATCLVALGTLISATWILAVNSWMQTPAGYTIDAATGRFLPADWVAVIFNPSFPFRFAHMVLAAFLSVSFVVGGTGAWHLLRGRRNDAVRTMFSMAMWMAALVTPLQVLVGDAQGGNTLKHQPIKIAAMEGYWRNGAPGAGVPMVLFALPDQKAQENRFEIAIPHVASLYLKHDWTGTIPALTDVPPENQPPVIVVFFAFRIMVALGMLMLAVGLWSLYERWRGRLFDTVWLHRAVLTLGPAGFAAVLAGWVVTEVGRQPYTVYGLLRTAESASPIGLPGMAISLSAFVIVYLIVYAAGISILLRMMGRPPEHGEAPPAPEPSRAAGIVPGPAGAVDDLHRDNHTIRPGSVV